MASGNRLVGVSLQTEQAHVAVVVGIAIALALLQRKRALRNAIVSNNMQSFCAIISILCIPELFMWL